MARTRIAMVVMAPAGSRQPSAPPIAFARLAGPGGILLLSAAFLLPGCGGDDAPGAGLLEIGTSDNTEDPAQRAFVPLHDGDIIEGGVTDGIPWIVVNLRADANPHAPDPTVTVTRGEVQIAEYPFSPRSDMEPDGGAQVMWDLQVVFSVLECCFELDEVLVSASLRDATGRLFAGQVRVRPLTSPGFSEHSPCCQQAEYCPDPSMAHLCEP